MCTGESTNDEFFIAVCVGFVALPLIERRGGSPGRVRGHQTVGQKALSQRWRERETVRGSQVNLPVTEVKFVI